VRVPADQHGCFGPAGTGQQKNCLALPTALEKETVGPAYKDVATKYENDPGASPRLAKKARGRVVVGGRSDARQPQSERGRIAPAVKWVAGA